MRMFKGAKYLLTLCYTNKRQWRQLQVMLWDAPINENIAQRAEFFRPTGLVWC